MNRSALLRSRVARPLLGKGRFSLTFSEPNGPNLRRTVQTLEPLHYSDNGEMKDIETAWTQTESGMVIRDAAFNASASLDLQAPEVLQISSQGLGIGFKPLPLYYANPASSLLLPNTMQRLVAPRPVTAQVQDSSLLWDGAYGPGTLLEWRATPTGVQKWLTVDAPGRFPTPVLTGKAWLMFGFAVTMPGLKAALKSGVVDLTNLETDETTVRLLGPDDTPILALQRPWAVDAAGESVQGKLKFQRFGTAIVVAAAFPLSWLQDPDRIYPVRIDPTVTSEQTVGPNDGWVNQGNLNAGGMYVGTRNSTDWGYQGFLRWADSAVPKGATIVSDTVSLTLGGSNGSAIDIAVEYEDGGNAAQLVDRPDFLSRTRTAVAGVWPVTTATGSKTTPNLKSGLQTVVNRSDYAVGSAVQMFLRDNLQNNTATVNRVRFETSETVTPTRETVYSEPATPGSTVTVYLRPRDSLDDGYSKSSGFNKASVSLVIGDISSADNDHNSFVLMTLDAGQVLPQGATLVKAELLFTSYGGATNNTDAFRISFQPADNPTAPTSKSDHDGRTRGTVLTWPSAPWSPRDTPYTVDVTSLVQGVVNRTGYNSGRMLLFIDGQGGGYGQINNNAQLYSYDGDPTKAVYLQVTYADPSPPILESVVMAR